MISQTRFAWIVLSSLLASVGCGDGANEPSSPGTSGGRTGGSGGFTQAGAGGQGGRGGANAAGSPSTSSGGAGLGGSSSPAGAGGKALGGSAGAVGTGGAVVAGTAGAGVSGAAGAVAAGGHAGVAGAAGGGAGGIGGGSGSGGAGGGASGGGGKAGVAGGGGLGGGGTGSAYEPCPATGACKIMPFGDSITEGFPVSGGYRTGLFHLALADAHELTFVGSARNGPAMVDGMSFPQQHEGHGGYTIDDNASRNTMGISPFVGKSIPNYQPDIITLMIGTNDLNGNIDVSSAPNRLAALLDSIHEEDAEVLVVLAKIVPTRTDGTNQVVRTYNDAMPALVDARQKMGHHLILIDMYAAFTKDADYKTALLGDNLHPNEAGYRRMAETWYAALEPYLR